MHLSDTHIHWYVILRFNNNITSVFLSIYKETLINNNYYWKKCISLQYLIYLYTQLPNNNFNKKLFFVFQSCYVICKSFSWQQRNFITYIVFSYALIITISFFLFFKSTVGRVYFIFR